jgi:hypothetical protein
MSTPVTSPGLTRCANPTVIPPGPQPQSSKRIPVFKCGKKKAACDSAVRRDMKSTAFGV